MNRRVDEKFIPIDWSPQNLLHKLFGHHRWVKCSPILGQRELEFSGVMAQFGGDADEPFISEI
ncbi:hypothetical protein, partial [Agrobacterium tumefaciens]|uniref:hypothetical protein n=1 Tax=Agrobacterium tumefaciens TaxID=358 RepID=UPI001BA9C74B